MLHLAAQHPETGAGLALSGSIDRLQLAQSLFVLPGQLKELGPDDVERCPLGFVQPLARDAAEDQPGGVGLAPRVPALRKPDLYGPLFLTASAEVVSSRGVLAPLDPHDLVRLRKQSPHQALVQQALLRDIERRHSGGTGCVRTAFIEHLDHGVVVADIRRRVGKAAAGAARVPRLRQSVIRCCGRGA